MRERSSHLNELALKISECKKCGLCKERQNALSGRFVEPSDAVIIDFMPIESEDKAGSLLAADRDKGIGKVLGLVKPSIDILKVSFVTAYKCFGRKPDSNECLSYLDEQLAILDPVLIITFGEETFRLITGRADLEMGMSYSTGNQNQYLLFPLLHPRDVMKNKDINLPIWMAQVEKLVKVAQKYDLKIFR